MKASTVVALSCLTLGFSLVYTHRVSALTIDEFSDEGSASSYVAGIGASAVTASSSAVGGRRTLYAVKTSSGAAPTRIETVDSILGYTQGTHTGQGVVTWDGEDAPSTLTTNGLGAIDLSEDGGTAVEIGISFFDYPFSQPFDITLRIYDSGNPSGLKYSEATLTLNAPIFLTVPFPVSIPFSAFAGAGTSSVAGPGGSTLALASNVGPAGAADLSKVGAIQLILNGSNAPDITLDFLRTNGRCTSVPGPTGKVLDECGVCLEHADSRKGADRCGVCFFGPPGYAYEDNKTMDACSLCPGEPNYRFPSGDKDKCGLCLAGPSPYVYTNLEDECGLCPSHPSYLHAKDPCGQCLGDGSSCADCDGTPNGGKTLDVCNVCGGNGSTCLDCNGVPFGGAVRDICGTCGGDGRSCLDCRGVAFGTAVTDACGTCGGNVQDPDLCGPGACVKVEANSEIKNFEKELGRRAKSLQRKFREEVARGKRNHCNIDSQAASARVQELVNKIVVAGREIFLRGVLVCGKSCLTVSYAEQVQSLAPSFKVLETETKSIAKQVQRCYQRLKIRSAVQTRGVERTIRDVKTGLRELIKRCKSRRVCPP